jgi:predicted transcriptional regulator
MKDLRQQHRSRSEIIASILGTANGNRMRQTEILYKTYLSHTLLKDYLLFLVENDLIEYTPGDRTFKTTEKGMRFLRMYEQMNDLMIMKKQPIVQLTGRDGPQLQGTA